MSSLLEYLVPAAVAPWLFLALFLAATFLMVWRLECMTANGMKGTVLGTLIMPYCSGMGNLIFALVVGVQDAANRSEVVTNALINNLTNLTLLIGLPALLWSVRLPAHRANAGDAAPALAPTSRSIGTEGPVRAAVDPPSTRSDLLLTLAAVALFTGVAWWLARDGQFHFRDGLLLTGMFLFWQFFHVFDVLTENAPRQPSSVRAFVLDLGLLGIGSYGVYVSVEWLVGWVTEHAAGPLSAKYLGWWSGWLMVVPNGLLALYYGWKRRADILYTSQVGDGHICIPLCLGLAALFAPVSVPGVFTPGVVAILLTTVLHAAAVMIWGGLPRWLAGLLVGGYVAFVSFSLQR